MDVDILYRFKKSDDTAFRIIYDNYYLKVFQYALALVKDVDQTNDIIQLSFIKLWLGRERLDVEKGLDAFLYNIVKSQVIDFFRTLKRNEILKQEYITHLGETYTDMMDILMADQLYVKIEEYIQKLPKQQARIFRLNKLEGYTIDEISKQLGLSKQTVKNHLVQAKKNLRGGLSEESLITGLITCYIFLS